MKKIQVEWFNGKGFWDHSPIRDLLDGVLWLPPNKFKFEQVKELTKGGICVEISLLTE